MKRILLFLLLPICIFLNGCESSDEDPYKGLTIIIEPESRDHETWGYIHRAEDITGLTLKWDLLWEYRQYTHYLDFDKDGDLDPAIHHPDMGFVGGWTAYNNMGWGPLRRISIHTEVVYGPDGKIGPHTGLTEAIRGVMRSNGYETPEIDAFLISKGLWL